MAYSLRSRAFKTDLHSRFVAIEEDRGHRLTDDEVRQEARYLLETIPYSGSFEGKELKRAIAQMKRLIK